ncbi:MAG: DNA/RNA-binding domain of Phe-tRNA-synthetase-like protein [Rhodothermales bacterium]
MTESSPPKFDQAITLTTPGGTEGVLFGLVWTIGMEPGVYPDGFEEQLGALLVARQSDLTAEEDATRKAARDILRFGRYKPTGRGKPASEYLIRAAREGSFPGISPAVDICNYISLKHLVPASVWDLDLAGQTCFARRGREGESYVFNASGQEIGLQDLLVLADSSDRPMVNPVKDSHRTKTHPASCNVAGIMYIPEAARLDAPAALEEFRELMAGCGPVVETGVRLCGGRA